MCEPPVPQLGRAAIRARRIVSHKKTAQSVCGYSQELRAVFVWIGVLRYRSVTSCYANQTQIAKKTANSMVG